MASWNGEELKVLLDSYMRMLLREIAGEDYNKSDENRLVQQLTGRSKGAVEFKHCNISAVLAEMGFPYISGYKPRSHVQTDLKSLVQNVAPHTLLSMKSAATDFNTSLTGSERSPSIEADLSSGSSGNIPPGNSDSMEISDRGWRPIQNLWDRATGGRGVAVKPDSSASSTAAFWPDALRPPAVSEAISWFKEGISNGGNPRFLFLVGGPGAGKSSAAAWAVADLEPIDIPGRAAGLAYRTYAFRSADRRILLVNDATISSKAEKDGALARDIDEALRTGSDLIVCVNRGVLVEETSYAAKTGREGNHRASHTLMDWLHSPDGADADTELGREPGAHWEIREQQHHGYVGVGELAKDSKVHAEVCAVFADVCSLFEARPAVVIESTAEGVTLSCQKYRVSQFSRRPELDSQVIPASVLLDRVMKLLPVDVTEGEEKWNPIIANLRSLTHPRVRSGVLDVIRGGEIAAGKRMTYRELWGSIVKCIVADLPAVIVREDVKSHLETLRPKTVDKVEILESMCQLAELRFSQAMFSSTMRRADGTFLDQNPVSEILGLVDPSRDAVPGDYDRTDASGWSSRIVEAFGGPISGRSPLKNLLRSLAVDDPMKDAVNEFDESLDEAFMKAIPQLSAQDRAKYYSWYGRYLTRLYAVANGIPAFRAEICMWTNAWHMSATVPNPLKTQLLTLLQPARDVSKPDSSHLIPVFDSRVDPMRGTIDRARLALTATSVDLESQTHGDSIFLVLMEDTKRIARVSLDFSMVREAMATSVGVPGITEQTRETAPRLERLRAARLTPKKLNVKNYMLVKGDEEWPLTVTRA